MDNNLCNYLQTFDLIKCISLHLSIRMSLSIDVCYADYKYIGVVFRAFLVISATFHKHL